MASIGGVTCTLVRGAIPTMREAVETWHVPGIDGEGAALLGLAGSDFALRAVYYGTGIEVEAWYLALQALQGTIVTVVNDWGVSRGRVLIQDVGALAKTACYIPGTLITARGEIPIKGTVL